MTDKLTKEGCIKNGMKNGQSLKQAQRICDIYFPCKKHNEQ